MGQLGAVYAAGLAERGMKVAIFDVAGGETPDGARAYEVDVTESRPRSRRPRERSRRSGACRTSS